MFVLRVVAANASYLVTSLLVKEVYLTMCESDIDRKRVKKKEEEQKKGLAGSATGSTPSGSHSPSDEGVVRHPLNPLPPGSLYPRAPGQNDSDAYTDQLNQQLIPPPE